LCVAVVGLNVMLAQMPDERPRPGQREELVLAPELQPLGPAVGMNVLLNDQLMFMLLLLPATIPMAIAAHSIVGEKQSRSLEAVLATPITTTELLVGKTLAAALPAIVLGWLAYVVACVAVAVVGRPGVLAFLVRPTWTIGMALYAPLLALLSTTAAVMGSARFNDPKAAQGVAAFFVVPLIGSGTAVLMGGLFGQAMLQLEWLLLGAGVLLVVDVVLLRIAVRVFGRESILTRWK
ncbi:MAG: ABC transporter permease, partial [Deltaproteobacteria bacterium]|nr:ABC transporter permease [Deltaproteobacteria bacterium]